MTQSEMFFIVVIIGVITFSIRSSCIIFFSNIDKLPYVKKALRFVPVTVLPALAVPHLFYNNSVLDISLSNERLIAGIIAILISIYKKNIFITLVTGMAVIWILKSLPITN